jgi:hypothetical protein
MLDEAVNVLELWCGGNRSVEREGQLLRAFKSFTGVDMDMRTVGPEIKESFWRAESLLCQPNDVIRLASRNAPNHAWMFPRPAARVIVVDTHQPGTAPDWWRRAGGTSLSPDLPHGHDSADPEQAAADGAPPANQRHANGAYFCVFCSRPVAMVPVPPVCRARLLCASPASQPAYQSSGLSGWFRG